ncbi:MAG: aminomethyl-transferring glycine dehydrogenase subunit GcvPA [gamma proteobacterium symbiont of Lucinoma myriamae]|nr:aminomethyl-transferring glycine dehydrogenase subunit GcvPA [gamma proteobacterium symbiont of Lucinoma myriamae]MCU7817411.1 aminomethyl-transferring glycine dehydrogenase subunit GcvPA [gamma proteobacterium symbiont of Lucinoma myriamae]MCU7832238.1 aminomethyl-transferring glycine dehydrogenase subunit GcvPA [gamma proteobacterium symbiont of Lucinoma myriamae]
MPYIPHTPNEVEEMLRVIGAESIEELFDEIPQELRIDLEKSTSGLDAIPLGQSEMAVQRLLSEKAMLDGTPLCFAGGGAYEHHIPAALWEVATRGEFYSAYTPYQAEASQGTLQVVYEFQSMIANLTALDVSNASLYDGASGLAEAVLMAVRANRKAKSKRILMPETVSPVYRQVVETIVKNQGITLESIDFEQTSGTINATNLRSQLDNDESFAALVIPQPNYFGSLEEVHQLTDWAHEHGGLVIAQVNPTALALLEAPGSWGEKGADIAVGEAQPLGIPMSSGGPFIGFIACKQQLVRQLPGRIIGRTVDLDGKPGFSLTLQAREQHIRRSKATSNICTNQGLMATAVTLYLSFLGADGLQKVAASCVANTQKLIALLAQRPEFKFPFGKTVFHEFVLELDVPVDTVLERLAQEDVVGGINLAQQQNDAQAIDRHRNQLLICVTETKTDEELQFFSETLIAICSDISSLSQSEGELS